MEQTKVGPHQAARGRDHTRENILDELEQARQIAKNARNGSAKAKVQGLIIDRREVGDVGAFDGKTDEELMEEAR